jgi:hypothetical protein
MNEYLSKLSPLERRFVVGMAVVFFIVLNLVFVWPHFGDRVKYKARHYRAQATLAKFDAEISKTKMYEDQIKALEGEGAVVQEEDQAIDFLRTIESQAAIAGVNLMSRGRQTTVTNQFFIERSQSITVQSGEQGLVTFLHGLGEGNSMVRVRGLSLRPDPPRQQLSANITLVASYQKKETPRGRRRGVATASTSMTENSKK